MNEVKYRSDIDGLRGISVLAVICYHYNIGNISGGFIGVDIFFVISGYLITSIINNQINAGTFTFVSFYARRIRRIFPAALLVILVTLIAGYFVILPSPYTGIGESAHYAAFGLSNFYFLWNTGYFSTGAEFHPLLHTWSLAVEEQYYLLWPLVLLAIIKIAKDSQIIKICSIVLIIVISLITSEYILRDDQKMAFYMLHSRAWELGLGGVIAFFPMLQKRYLALIASIIGVLLIGWGMVSLTDKSPFPGVNALYACIGAALLILPKEKNIVERMLSVNILVFIGKISFSLYLWHWPILVLYRHYGTGRMPVQDDKIALLLICLILSVITWRYVEQTFRKKQQILNRYVYTTGLSSMFGVGILGLYVTQASGFPQRLPESIRNVEELTNETVTSQNGLARCFISSLSEGGVKYYSDDECLKIDPNKKNVLIVGDSHAAHYGKALRDVYPDIQFSQVTGSGCLPILKGKGKSMCHVLMRKAIDETIPQGQYDTVIFSARWTKKSIGSLVNVVKWTKKYSNNVVVLGPTVEYAKPLPTLLAKSSLRHDGGEIVNSARLYKSSADKSQLIASRLKGLGVEYYSIVRSICPNKKCLVVDKQGGPMQFDYGHFTYSGSHFVIESLKQQGLLKGQGWGNK